MKTVKRPNCKVILNIYIIQTNLSDKYVRYFEIEQLLNL
jgi:hypothetical protein